MALNFNAKIIINAKEKTGAIHDSVSIGNAFYPENPVKTKIKLDDNLTILVTSENLSHLRANLNSTLRLVQASYGSIESVKRFNAIKNNK